METIIQVESLSKIYKLYDNPSDRVREAVSPSNRKYHRDFFALRDISFNIFKGETFGIIGRNGSGKSTLLKILSGVTTQTTGKTVVIGRIAALLELGAGLNPEMTGIENIYLNGTMQGFSRDEISGRLKDIVEFADIGEFIDQPVKTYSSGMFVRLAFGMAINIDPDILIIDEALSVGDIFFQLKCYKKFEEIKTAGKTILFVTHDMSSVLKYCDRAILLEKGTLVALGSPKEIVDIYKKTAAMIRNDEVSSKSNVLGPITTGRLWKEDFILNPNVLDYGDGRIRIIDYGLFDDRGSPMHTVIKGREYVMKMRVRAEAEVQAPIFAFTIKDIKGNELTGTNSRFEGVDFKQINPGEVYDVTFKMEMALQAGQYFVSLGCTRLSDNGELTVHHRLYDVFSFHVVANNYFVGVFDMNMDMMIKRVN